MENKKLWLVMVLLLVSGTLFGQILDFQYVANWTEQRFSEVFTETVRKFNFLRVEKIPNTIIQAINYALDDYSLSVGDSFVTRAIYYNTEYLIILIITDVRNRRWQYHACRERL